MWKYVLFGQELVNRGKCANTAFGTARTSPTLLKDQMAIVIFSWILSNVSALHRTGKKELSDQERRKPTQNLSFKVKCFLFNFSAYFLGVLEKFVLLVDG